MPDTNMNVSSVAGSTVHSTIGLTLGGGISEAAAGQPNSSLLPASANTTHLESGDNDAVADKRWVGSLVCLATALVSASLIAWLFMIMAG